MNLYRLQETLQITDLPPGRWLAPSFDLENTIEKLSHLIVTK